MKLLQFRDDKGKMVPASYGKLAVVVAGAIIIVSVVGRVGYLAANQDKIAAEIEEAIVTAEDSVSATTDKLTAREIYDNCNRMDGDFVYEKGTMADLFYSQCEAIEANDSNTLYLGDNNYELVLYHTNLEDFLNNSGYSYFAEDVYYSYDSEFIMFFPDTADGKLTLETYNNSVKGQQLVDAPGFGMIQLYKDKNLASMEITFKSCQRCKPDVLDYSKCIITNFTYTVCKDADHFTYMGLDINENTSMEDLEKVLGKADYESTYDDYVYNTYYTSEDEQWNTDLCWPLYDANGESISNRYPWFSVMGYIEYDLDWRY